MEVVINSERLKVPLLAIITILVHLAKKEKLGNLVGKFNKGKCKFGMSCRYDHHCSYCLKFGHNVINCHKLVADCERNGSGGRWNLSLHGQGHGNKEGPGAMSPTTSSC